MHLLDLVIIMTTKSLAYTFGRSFESTRPM